MLLLFAGLQMGLGHLQPPPDHGDLGQAGFENRDRLQCFVAGCAPPIGEQFGDLPPPRRANEAADAG